MKWTSGKLNGVWRIEPTRIEDARGFFVRTWDAEEFQNRQLCTNWVQNSISFNHKAGTIRGMHWQQAPYQETKLIRCSQGKMIDVLIDLREDSETYLQHETFFLSAENGHSVYLPKGIAHGFQTLVDDTEVNYQISEVYSPELARVVRWDDPTFGIKWPLPVSSISQRDAEASLWSEKMRSGKMCSEKIRNEQKETCV